MFAVDFAVERPTLTFVFLNPAQETHVMQCRRLGLAITTGALGMVLGCSKPQTIPEHHSTSAPSKSITIHQEINFEAHPQRLYEALLDAKQFRTFSGRPAEIDRDLGGAFSLFGAHIVGRNVELVPNQRIVQAWRVVTWPEGVYSIVRFELRTEGSGTHIVFDHTGFPEGLHDHLEDGWETNYWALLKKYFQ